jgi:hypothetical protein
MNGALDSSSYTQAMTDTGTTDAAGAIGRARSVGTGMTLLGPSDSSLQLDGDVTLSAWVNFSSLASGSYRNSIVTYGDPTFALSTNFQYGFYVTQTTALFSYWAHGAATTVNVTSSSTSGLPLDEFHHVAMVRDASAGVVRFYYDGVELGAPVAYDAPPDGGENSHLVVGGNAAADDYAMNGVLDEVRISALALDAPAVRLEYLSMSGALSAPVMDP